MISNVLVQQVYTTDGLTLNFPIPFAFLPEDPEIVTKVYKVDLVTGAKTLQHIGALNDYTLPHDIDTQPANVVFNAAPNNCYVLVTRLLDLEQNIAFINSGAQLLTNIENGMDILTMLIQQVNEKAKRAVTLNDADALGSFDTNLPLHLADNPGAVVIVNATGDGFIIGPTADIIYAAQGYAAAAAASAVSSQNANTASLGHAVDSAASAAAAAASAIAAAASAAAAIAAGLDDTTSAITDGQVATPILSEAWSGLLYKGIYYIFTVIRGTTVISQGTFGMVYKNAVWSKVEGPYSGDLHGLTWSVTQVGVIGTLNVAADVGAGDGTAYFKRTKFHV